MELKAASGYVVCPPCDGTGLYPLDHECSICDEGKQIEEEWHIWVEADETLCSECGGTGRVIPHDQGDHPFCTGCHGRGWRSP